MLIIQRSSYIYNMYSDKLMLEDKQVFHSEYFFSVTNLSAGLNRGTTAVSRILKMTNVHAVM